MAGLWLEVVSPGAYPEPFFHANPDSSRITTELPQCLWETMMPTLSPSKMDVGSTAASRPSSMHKYIQEQEIKKNYRNETFEQIAFSQDLEEWYLRTNKRWWYQSRKLRSLEDTYKKWGQNGLNAKRYQASLSSRSERGLTWGLRRSNHSSYGAVKTPLGPAVTIWAMKNTLVDREINGLNHTWCAVDDWLLLLIGK